jgi:hypothetical protein
MSTWSQVLLTLYSHLKYSQQDSSSARLVNFDWSIGKFENDDIYEFYLFIPLFTIIHRDGSVSFDHTTIGIASPDVTQAKTMIPCNIQL